MQSIATTNYEEKEKNSFGSRRVFALILLYRVVSVYNTLILPQVALKNGSLGCLLCFCFCYVVLGIPIVYMELTVGQYTGRDCIDMWKIRPCLSHVGYFVLLWQGFMFIHNHAIVSIILHYLFVSFENPPQYNKCGKRAPKYCNIIRNNETAYTICMRHKDHSKDQECTHLFITYPEYEFYNNVFSGDDHDFYVAWPVCVASTVVILIMFLICCKRITSVKWFIYPTSMYPYIGYLLLLIGCMRQKGFIFYYGEVMDLTFEKFNRNARFSTMLLQTLYSVGAGTGIISNLASMAPFRSQCFSHAVTSVLTSAAFSVITIAITAMMACPYAFEYNTDPHVLIDHPISFTFIKIPRMIFEFHNKNLFLLLFYSIQLILGVNYNVVVFFTILEVVAKRYPVVGKYSATATFMVAIIMFIITVPILGKYGKNVLGINFRRNVFLVSIFYAAMETVVFMLWYGYTRFFEDIHFMQGFQPKSYVKVGLIIVGVLLMYVFLQDLLEVMDKKKEGPEFVGYLIMLSGIVLPVVILLVKLVVAAFKKNFMAQFKLDPLWGPQSDVLRRSRAIFTAQAMTKEYMYRQYHLQAGVVARQRVSNVRSPQYPMA